MAEGLEKSPVMVLQETVVVPKSIGTTEQNEEEGLSSNGKSTYTALVARLYHPPIPYPQRLAWTKLSMLEPRFARFLDILKCLCRYSFLGGSPGSTFLFEISERAPFQERRA